MQTIIRNIVFIHDHIELQIQASAGLRDENRHVQPGQSAHFVRVSDGGQQQQYLVCFQVQNELKVET